jgi:hypothetical protein
MFKQALKIIHKEFSQANIKWAVIGSTNLNLQGVDIEPKDLDIAIGIEDIKKVKRIFKKYCDVKIQKVKILDSNDTISKIEIKLKGFNVEIVGEKNSRVYSRNLLSNQIIKIKLGNLEIPCFTLEAEAKAYLARKRFKRVKMIEEFLSNKAYPCTNQA